MKAVLVLFAFATIILLASANPKNNGDHGHAVLDYHQPAGKSHKQGTYSAEYKHNIYRSKNGEITVGAGAQKAPHYKTEPKLGIEGKFRF